MSEFGALVSPWNVEQAVIALLQDPPAGGLTYPRLVYYLAEWERDNNLAAKTLGQPPGPSSYRGGVDAFTLRAEWFPMVHVIAQPKGNAERVDPATYAQAYEVQAVATVGDDDEDVARMKAAAYGTAIEAAVVQYGSLGIGATQTVITATANTELLDPDTARQVARSTVVFSTLINPVVQSNGPTAWPADPYATPPDWPTVQTENIDVIAESLT